jgi:hypothetical protein
MKHLHGPSVPARKSMRTPLGAQPIAEDAAASSPRTSEGPVPSWASEAEPSDPSPTAHISQEPLGSPPSRRGWRGNRTVNVVPCSTDDVTAIALKPHLGIVHPLPTQR